LLILKKRRSENLATAVKVEGRRLSTRRRARLRFSITVPDGRRTKDSRCAGDTAGRRVPLRADPTFSSDGRGTGRKYPPTGSALGYSHDGNGKKKPPRAVVGRSTSSQNQEEIVGLVTSFPPTKGGTAAKRFRGDLTFRRRENPRRAMLQGCRIV